MNIYKKTIECECGQDYGNCGRPNIFIHLYSRSCDIGELLVKHHASEPNSKFESLGFYNDADISAIIDVLRGEGDETLTDEERRELKQITHGV